MIYLRCLRGSFESAIEFIVHMLMNILCVLQNWTPAVVSIRYCTYLYMTKSLKLFSSKSFGTINTLVIDYQQMPRRYFYFQA